MFLGGVEILTAWDFWSLEHHGEVPARFFWYIPISPIAPYRRSAWDFPTNLQWNIQEHPLVNIQKAMKNGHINSWYTHKNSMIFQVMLVYQRVERFVITNHFKFPAQLHWHHKVFGSWDYHFSSGNHGLSISVLVYPKLTHHLWRVLTCWNPNYK